MVKLRNIQCLPGQHQSFNESFGIKFNQFLKMNTAGVCLSQESSYCVVKRKKEKKKIYFTGKGK